MWTARKIALFLALNLAAVLALFAVVEGLAAAFFFLKEDGRRPADGGPTHARSDSLLGWINIPGASFPDFYGAGIDVHINSQGCRGPEDFSFAIPPRRIRLICTGDSFTFGQGVDDDQSWPALLESLDDRLQTVNMGQPGYGVDQAYLRYKRDGLALEHDLLVFAFITWDFYRMSDRAHQEQDKPYLVLEGDSLVVTNVPIDSAPGRAFSWRRFTPSELRSIRLAQRLIARLRPPSADPADGRPDLEEVAVALISDLQRTARSRGSDVVLVHLPILPDADPERAKTNAWRALLGGLADSLGIAYLDLVEAMRQMPRETIPGLFLPEPENPASGHYSIEGNRVFAEALLSKLLALPEVQRRLDRLDQEAPAPHEGP